MCVCVCVCFYGLDALNSSLNNKRWHSYVKQFMWHRTRHIVIYYSSSKGSTCLIKTCLNQCFLGKIDTHIKNTEISVVFIRHTAGQKIKASAFIISFNLSKMQSAAPYVSTIVFDEWEWHRLLAWQG